MWRHIEEDRAAAVIDTYTKYARVGIRRESDGSTPLAVAIEHQSRTVIASLLDAKADILDENFRNVSVFETAARMSAGGKHLAHLLVMTLPPQHSGKRVSSGATLLHIAARYDCDAAAVSLHRNGGEQSHVTAGDAKLTPIALAIVCGSFRTAKRLLWEKRNPIDATQVTLGRRKWSLLHLACMGECRKPEKDHLAMVYDILESTKAIDIDAQDAVDGLTPLHLALCWRLNSVAKLLIKRGAKLSMQTKSGLTGTDIAVQCGIDPASLVVALDQSVGTSSVLTPILNVYRLH